MDIVEIFKIILYNPLLNLLVFFYNIVPGNDLGLAIILITLLIKIIFLPLSLKSIRSQKNLQKLQPKIKEIKEKYKNQPQKISQEIMKLYRENKVNPLSSCLPLLIQFPILIALYRVFIFGLTAKNLPVYSFLNNPGQLNPIAFGFLNLAKVSVPLVIITALVQYFQTKFLPTQQPPKKYVEKGGAKDENIAAVFNKQMKFLMPVITIIIGINLPSGLMFYWLISILFSILEQKLVYRFWK